jgi:hypothetical protein
MPSIDAFCLSKCSFISCYGVLSFIFSEMNQLNFTQGNPTSSRIGHFGYLACIGTGECRILCLFSRCVPARSIVRSSHILPTRILSIHFSRPYPCVSALTVWSVFFGLVFRSLRSSGGHRRVAVLHRLSSNRSELPSGSLLPIQARKLIGMTHVLTAIFFRKYAKKDAETVSNAKSNHVQVPYAREQLWARASSAQHV